jgi:Arc/MetJ family transcription regulator
LSTYRVWQVDDDPDGAMECYAVDADWAVNVWAERTDETGWIASGNVAKVKVQEVGSSVIETFAVTGEYCRTYRATKQKQQVEATQIVREKYDTVRLVCRSLLRSDGERFYSVENDRAVYGDGATPSEAWANAAERLCDDGYERESGESITAT